MKFRCVAPRFVLLAIGIVLVGCNTDGSGAPGVAAAPAAKPKLTHIEAAKQCWMATEQGGKSMSLDKRADIVTKCIDDKMKADNQPAAQAKSAPETTAHKPKS